MQKTKKTLSVLLSILMVLSLLPMAFVPAFAADDTCTWSYDEGTKTLSFIGSGAMEDFVPNGSGAGMIPETPWSAYEDEAEAVVIGEGITSVGAYSFAAFTKLAQVTLPSTVTVIGEGAFAYCFALEEINLPAGLTSIGEMAFGFNKLTNVVIPAGVTKLNTVFSYNLAPLSITLPEGLTSIANCFQYTMIENLTIPSTVTSFVTGEGDPLRILNVKNLVNNSSAVAVSDYLASVSEERYEDFFYMEKMEYLSELSYLRTGEYPTEEDMYVFYVEVYNTFLGTNFTDYFEMVEAFENGEFTEEQLARLNEMDNATRIVNVPLSSVRIYCLQDSAEHDALRQSGYPHYIIDNGNALCEEPLNLKCGDNLTWTVDNGALVITGFGAMYDDYKGWLFRRDEIGSIRFVQDGGAITYIGSNAFANLGALDTVALPAGVTNFGYGWLENSSIGTLVIPAGFGYRESYQTEGIFSSNCRNIAAYSVEEGNALYFSDNSSLYAETDGDIWLLRAAANAPLRSDIDVIAEYAFSYHNELTDVTIPASVKEVQTYAFNYCENLQTVTIEPATHPLDIMLSSFQYCSALSSFAVDAADLRFAVQDGVLYTKDMTKLVAVPFTVTELTLPETVTGILRDGQNAYGGGMNTGIRKLTVPNSDFDFGYGNYSSTSAFTMAYANDASVIEIYGNGGSTAEAFAACNSYTFISLDGVTLENVEFDLSRVPQRAIIGEHLSFHDWQITGVATYSNGTTKELRYGDFSIWYKTPNSNYWEENNWVPLEYGEGEYLFEARYGNIAVPFSVTVTQPDYHYEFDTSEAVTEVKQYKNQSNYVTDDAILGVKLYKVYDDPDTERELANIHSYVNVNYGENNNWWNGLMSEEPGEYDVTFRYQDGLFTAEETIRVRVVPGDVSLVFDFSELVTEAEQFTSLTDQNLGLKAKLVTVGGREYDVSDRIRFTSFTNGEEPYNGIDNSVDTTVPGTKRINAYLNLYEYYYLDDNDEGQYFTVYKSLAPIYVEVTPAADVDHVRIELPEVIEAKADYTVNLLDYVKAYKVFADGTEEEFADYTGMRFEGRSSNGGYSGNYITLYSVGETVQYTISFAGETASMRVVCVCDSHTLTPIAAKDATCTADGNIAYWYCSVCGKLFADEACENEIDLADTVIPAAHSLEEHAAKAATCTEAGNTAYWYCTACEKYFSDANAADEITLADTVIPAAHTLEEHAAKAATCKEAGNVAYWYCTACGKYFSDANAANEIAESDIAVPKLTTHTWDNGTLTKPATCKEEGVKTYTCTVCGATNPEPIPKLTTHTWNAGTVTLQPTCTAEGVKTFTCTVCGATKTEPVGKVPHRDNNNDGLCDYGCGTSMGGQTPSQPDQPSQPSGGDQCKYCGETHTGFFGKIVQFFHNILYFFKNLFKR